MADSRRAARRLAGAVAVLIVVAALAAWKGGRLYDKVLDLRYGTTLPPPAGGPPADATAARMQDLAYIAALPDVDRSFTPEAAARFRDRIARLRAEAGSLDSARFFMGIAEAVALSGNAHTNVDAVSWRAQLNSAPVRFFWFPEGLFVIRATAAHADLLGERVVAIDGRDPEALEREAARYFAGTAEYVRVMSPLLLESPQALHVLHPEASAASLVVRVQDAAGRTRDVELEALAAGTAPREPKPGRFLSPVRLRDERGEGWRALLESTPIPPSLREPDRTMYATRLAEGVLYLHLWRIRDVAGEPIGAGILRALGGAGTPPWRRIVLDLRFDAGGDYPTVYRALRALPDRLAPGGRLAILTDETTFSAAIIAAVLARHFAGPRAAVLGSRVGDRLAFWAEGTPARLPNSGIEVGVSTGYHDWSRGCRALRCWWPNIWYGVAGGDLTPDVPVAWRFADYRRGVDPVLRRALE